ncbi:protein adenylyltransferase SelO [Stenotrophomonas mori]|uniref:Protein nucleotidyltransferase YdiU n=1 Tax=Stenotrophomonas mori TaxID=2871096 RepID=A0ABT0SEM9_9GAMM|nr:YdiU family protein [Stenotrophomonas mori]MCL7713772.1 YdiU family protein [Stenotrophomonas mori]
MTALVFDNRFLRELPGDPEQGARRRQVRGAAWSPVTPTPVAAPRLLAHSPEVAALLGISAQRLHAPAFAEVFGGNALYPGMQPWAANYGGHQFGHWAGQLGDGRAISLGELLADGRRWELQLKGAGPTPYSRGADGRAVLRSSIREFLCSEAMHHLGVPSTRALCLVATGERVVRDMFYDGRPQAEPGAVVCRVAPSFLRFGSFELPAARGEQALLQRLVDVCIDRDFPHLAAGPSRRADWFAEVCTRTATMVAQWMRVGFVHGVMNTDNMSILGLTLDYGPYGWVEDYDPDWTPNTTDAQDRRYRFGAQVQVAYWNLVRLAQALAPVFGEAGPLQAGLDAFRARQADEERAHLVAKLGLDACREGDEALMARFQELLQRGEMDMTLAFRGLAGVDPRQADAGTLEAAFYSPARRAEVMPDLLAWLDQYAARVRDAALPGEVRRRQMAAANPKYVLRNWLVQQAIDRAEQGDPAGIADLLEVMRHPCDEQPGREAFAQRRPDWARERAGCSMLSCSS